MSKRQIAVARAVDQGAPLADMEIRTRGEAAGVDQSWPTDGELDALHTRDARSGCSAYSRSARAWARWGFARRWGGQGATVPLPYRARRDRPGGPDEGER